MFVVNVVVLTILVTNAGDRRALLKSFFWENVNSSLCSWATIVKGTSGIDDNVRARRDEKARQIREKNELAARGNKLRRIEIK